MRTGREIGFTSRAGGNLVGDVEWVFAASPPQRVPPGGGPAASPELAELAWASVAVRRALAEMTVAAQVAAEGARAIVEVMDAAVAVLDGAERGRLPDATSRVVARSDGGLSPREREVLALVAEGCSNKAIAEALFVSPNTIKTHVASLMNKLHADSRAQLAAIATRQELLRNDVPTPNDVHSVTR